MSDPVRLLRQITVFDAADVAAESRSWADLLGGSVLDEDEDFHCVLVEGRWRFGVQRSPGHVPSRWPDGVPQQVHLDLHVADIRAAHAHAVSVGARLLRAAADLDAPEGHQVYADPAGHPFCLGWHPDVRAEHDVGATSQAPERA